MSAPDRDQEEAAREHWARIELLEAGASSLPRAPWLHPSQPPSSVDLVRFAVWRGQTGTIGAGLATAALSLLPSARAEIEQLETAMLFTARAGGMSWGGIARAMGLGSAQAALQRFDRLTGRVRSRGQD